MFRAKASTKHRVKASTIVILLKLIHGSLPYELIQCPIYQPCAPATMVSSAFTSAAPSLAGDRTPPTTSPVEHNTPVDGSYSMPLRFESPAQSVIAVPSIIVTDKNVTQIKAGTHSINLNKLRIPDFPMPGMWNAWKSDLVGLLHQATFRPDNLVLRMINAIMDPTVTMAYITANPSFFAKDEEQKIWLSYIDKPLGYALRNIKTIPYHIKKNVDDLDYDLMNQADPDAIRCITWAEVLKLYVLSAQLDAATQIEVNWDCLKQLKYMGDNKLQDFYETWVRLVTQIGQDQFNIHVRTKGEPWLLRCLENSEMFKDDIRRYESQGIGYDREEGYRKLLDIIMAELRRRTMRRERSAAEARPAQMLRGQLAAIGLTVSGAPAAPAEKGKGKGKKGKGKERKRKRWRKRSSVLNPQRKRSGPWPRSRPWPRPRCRTGKGDLEVSR